MKFQTMTTVNQARDLWPDWFREASSAAPSAPAEEYLVPVDPASLTDCDSCQ